MEMKRFVKKWVQLEHLCEMKSWFGIQIMVCYGLDEESEG